jgi:hypothetical protein
MADITADHGFLSANFANLGHNRISVFLRNLKIEAKPPKPVSLHLWRPQGHEKRIPGDPQPNWYM